MGRKPVFASDGTLLRLPNGTPRTEPDYDRYMKDNWLGHLAFLLSFVFLLVAVARFAWSAWRRLRNRKYQSLGAIPDPSVPHQRRVH